MNTPEMQQLAIDELDRLRKENQKLNTNVTNLTYMLEAHRQMLGPKGREVSKQWKESRLVRIRTDWIQDPYSMEGEEVAQHQLDIQEATKASVPIDNIDEGVENIRFDSQFT